MTRYDLYRLCVQDAPATVRFLLAAHGRGPRVLRDDFAGPAGLAVEWASSSPRRRAVAIDIDPQPLAHAPDTPRLTRKVADATKARDRADVIALFNFAACETHTRKGLLAYFKVLRASLNPRGILALDIYGGSTAFTTGSRTTFARLPGGKQRVRYTWQQKHADAATGMVENHLHFALGRRAWPSAFVYRWRLWSIPELRDTLSEAGFASVEVHDRLGDAIDHRGRLRLHPVDADRTLDEDFVAYVIARK